MSQLVRLEGKHTIPNGHCALHRQVSLDNVDHIDHVDVIDDVPPLHRQVCLDNVDHIGGVDVIDDVNAVIVDVTQYHCLKVRPPSFMLYS